MNINKVVLESATSILAKKKSGLKTYKTEETAEKATAFMAHEMAVHFGPYGAPRECIRSARYVVAFIPSVQRWVGAIDMTEVLTRANATGGYLGFAPGFIKF